jgi:predicted SAM-dependent methyltransferase
MKSRDQQLKRPRVLDVGSGLESAAGVVLEHLNPDVVRLDVNPKCNPDILHDITNPFPEGLQDSFDVVYVSHVLEHIDRDQVITVLKNVIACLKDGGEIWLLVPSMEWAAEQVMHGRDHAGIQLALYGGQQNPNDYHRSGFTLNALRFMVESQGLFVRKAYTAPFLLGIYGKEYQALQNIVIAIRNDAWHEEPNNEEGE